jgi:hypothetical protein
MFKTMRFAIGANGALHTLFERGLISQDQRDRMVEVAGNDANRAHGVLLLKTGAARNRHGAAAAVFARLSVSAQKTPTGDITAEHWQWACRQAFVNGGLNLSESTMSSLQLIEHYGGDISAF